MCGLSMEIKHSPGACVAQVMGRWNDVTPQANRWTCAYTMRKASDIDRGMQAAK